MPPRPPRMQKKGKTMTQVSAGPVVEKTIRTRTLSNDEIAAESKGRMPDFWATLEATTPEQFQDAAGPLGWKLAIIREDPKPSNYGGQNTLEQIKSGFLEVRPGVSVPVNDQEEFELGIKQKYGGRSYRLLLKRGKERITEGKCVNDAVAKFPDSQSYTSPPPNPVQIADSSAAAVANKAIDTIANQNPQLITIAIDAIRNAADLVMKKNEPRASETDEIEKEFRRAMIHRMLNPPDPFAEIAKYKEIFQPANTVKDTLELLSAIGQSPFLRFNRNGGGNNWIADLAGSTVPVVADAVKSAVRDWPLGMEAQERGVSIARGVTANPAAQPSGQVTVLPAPEPHANPAPPPAGKIVEQPPAAATPAAPASIPLASPDPMLPPMEFIEQKIVEMLQRNEPIEDTVDLVLDWLEVTDARLIPLLLDPPKLDVRLKPGDQGLLQLFQWEPILRQVPVNPRLVEFIKKFIAKAKAERQTAAEPTGSGEVLLKPEPPK